MTDDPIDKKFLSVTERENSTKNRNEKLRLQMSWTIIIIFDEKNGKSTPWIKIFQTPMFWIATIQMFSHSWGAQVTVMCMKKYLLAMHGYSIKEASRIVLLLLVTMNCTVCFSHFIFFINFSRGLVHIFTRSDPYLVHFHFYLRPPFRSLWRVGWRPLGCVGCRWGSAGQCAATKCPPGSPSDR